MADPSRVDKGPITAYAMAVAGGYTGTYEEFCVLMANFGTAAARVHADMLTTEGYKNDAASSKQAAAGSASSAAGSATSAGDSATAASNSASTANQKATAAAESASEAQGYKNDAKDSKDAAAASAAAAAESAATFSTDKTLEIEDKAADAKATGDRLKPLENLGLSVVDGMICVTFNV